jgi:hypothetical protein
MNCRKGWSREILVNEFTNSFVNKTYKEHRENVLFDRERSLMPETQPYVEVEKKCRELHQQKEQLELTRREFARNAFRHVPYNASMETRIQVHRDHTNCLIQERTLACEMAHIDFIIQEYRNTGPKERRVFTRACPTDGCKGFLSTAWKCGLCNVHVCSKCHEVKVDGEDEHICDPNSVATAEMIARDSKACPKCASIIFKIDGCDQMFCTQCHTAFSWRTGRIETGTIHNPHYYDYMRTHGGGLPRAPGDVLCGGLPNILQNYEFRSVYPNNSVIYNIHRLVSHVQHVVLPRYTPFLVADTNRDLRIKYMLNELTEDEFKHKIQVREKAENRKRDIREVLTMFTIVATDIFQRILTPPIIMEGNYITELTMLREYTTESLQKVSKRWKCAVPQFVNWDMI